MHDGARPPLHLRFGIIAAAVIFCSIARNPLVRLEAMLGLSPAPWERFTGMKTIFSGMTEGFYRLAQGDLRGASSANILSAPFAIFLVWAVLSWRWPRMTSRFREGLFLLGVVLGSLLINLVHG